MKYLSYLFIICCLLITGCSSDKENVNVTMHNNEIKDLEQLYEEKISLLNSRHDLVLNEKNDEINKLKKELDNIKDNYEKLKDNVVDGKPSNCTIVEAEGKIFKLFSVGTENLENGIVCILEAFDTSNDLLWMQSWNELQVSELATYSPITISKDKVYIVISGELNVLNASDGEIIWSVANVGSSFEAPLVDSEGKIYVIGQYNPYLTAINQEGIIMWQVKAEELYGASSINFEGEYLLVECYKGTLKYDKNGNRLELTSAGNE